MNLEKIMSQPIVTVSMDDSLRKVKEIFDNANFHHVLVVESNKLVGVISDRDLLKAMSPNVGAVSETAKDRATLNKKAHQILTRQPISLSPKSGIYEAIDIFNHHSISCIPVVDEKNTPVGIISWRDILRVIGENRRK